MQNAVTDAVRRLRLALGDTQQSFAARTGMAISTVVRYELSRPPKGQALDQLRRIAEENNLHEIARVFTYALGNTPETAPLHAAIDSLWWNRRHLSRWPLVANGIESLFQELIAKKKTAPESMDESLAELEDQLFHLRRTLYSTAKDKMNNAAARILQSEPHLTWEQAIARAVRGDPTLYTLDNQETADAATGTTFEKEFATYGTRQHATEKAQAAAAKKPYGKSIPEEEK